MKIKKYLITFFLLLLFITAFAFAEEKEENLYYNGSEQDLIIYVSYEQPGVKIAFLDPDEHKVSLDSANVKYIEFDGGMMIMIQNAAEGQWKLVYDKGSNDSIRVNVQVSEDPIWISSFSVKADGDTLDYKFKVSQDQDRDFSYEIRIGTDEEMNNYRVIDTGWGSCNETIEESASLEDLNTYDEYYAQLYVYYDRNGITYFDEAVSDSFSYTALDSPDPLSDFGFEISEDYRIVYVNLDGYTPWGAQTAYVKLTADGNPLFDDFMDLSVMNSFTLPFDEGVQSFKCEISLQYTSGRVSEVFTKEVNLSPSGNEFMLLLPETDTLSDDRYEFSYSNADETIVRFDFGNDYTDVELNGDGTSYITLPAQQNNIEISYTDDSGSRRVYNRIVNIDTIPPALKIYEQLNGMTTNDDIVIITGKTDTDAVLTIDDGTVIELSELGTFSYEMKLNDGENTINFVSEDPAGNATVYSLKITKGKAETEEAQIVKNEKANKLFSKLPLISGIAGGLFVLIELLILLVSLKKKKPAYSIMKGMSIILLVFSAAALIFDIVYYTARRSFENSADYIDLAIDDPKAANQYLDTTAMARTFIIIFAIAAGVAVILLLISILLKSRNNPGKKAEREKKKAEAKAANKSKSNESSAKKEETKAAPAFCTGCGSKLEAGARFCTKCGKKLM